MKADANGKKEILILGGTRFFGPALIEKLLESSGKAVHITCFHRGLHNAAFPCSEVSFLTGDRYSSRDMAELFEREWDTVIDLSGTDEQTITTAMQYACGRCRRYVFISSSSVYAPGDLSPHRENEPLKNGTGEPYAIAKINGERLLRELFPCHTIIRPSKVYGPGNYWFSERDYLKRLQDSPLVCLKNDPVLHFTYISDLAEGICALLDKDGTFNVAGAEPALRYHRSICFHSGFRCPFLRAVRPDSGSLRSKKSGRMVSDRIPGRGTCAYPALLRKILNAYRCRSTQYRFHRYAVPPQICR